VSCSLWGGGVKGHGAPTDQIERHAIGIVLTVSLGRLGRCLAPQLRAAGHTDVRLDMAPGTVTTVLGSVADEPAVQNAFANHGVEAVSHAGGMHKPHIARFPPAPSFMENVCETLNLLQAAANAGHDRFIVTSTSSLMITAAIRAEAAPDAAWLDEDFAPLSPCTIHVATKLAAENLSRPYAAPRSLCCIALPTVRSFLKTTPWIN
jgi:nucleoside-diphosphate-sugar epimerase